MELHEPAAADAEGRRIYRTGHAAAGPPIVAVLGGEGGAEIGADTLPCAGCHGRDGHGRPEGGLVPPDITWDVLTRPYGATGAGSRQHPPYDVRSLKRAITLGIDAGGNQLLGAMPRYRLSQSQAADLVAYLQVLGHEAEPGLTARQVRLGVLLPAEPEAAGAVRADLDAYAERLARHGGIFGRRLELVYLEGAPAMSGPAGAVVAAGDQRQRVERFVASRQPFALVASSFAGAETALAAMAADLELPVIGALTAAPPADNESGRYVFYLQSGLADQARALVQAATGFGGAGGAGGDSGAGSDRRGGVQPAVRLGLLAPAAAAGAAGSAARGAGTSAASGAPADAGAAAAPEAGGEARQDALGGTVEAARDECARLGITPWMATFGAEDGDLDRSIAGARAAGLEALVFLGGEGAARRLLTDAAAAPAWRPRIYLLAELAAGALPAATGALAGRVFLGAPTVPADMAPQGEALLRSLAALPPGSTMPPGSTLPPGSAAPGGEPRRPLGTYRRAALAAIEVVTEALTRAGRDVDRDRLVDAVEALHDFPTGLWPPITFGPGRRIGALGARLVLYDPHRQSVAPAGGWITPR